MRGASGTWYWTEMMDLSDLITPEAVLGSLKANSKKQAIQAIAEKAATLTGMPEREIFDTLLQREKLGSTGVGGGIAIPHGKLAEPRPHLRPVRAAAEADRFRGARRPAGRPGLPAARAGRRRRRSPQGARPHRPAAARARRRRQTPRLGRQVGALRGAHGATPTRLPPGRNASPRATLICRATRFIVTLFDRGQ